MAPLPPLQKVRFTDWSVQFPNLPQRGDLLDTEFNALRSSLTETIEFIRIFANDDGSIRAEALPAPAGQATLSSANAAALNAAVQAAMGEIASAVAQAANAAGSADASRVAATTAEGDAAYYAGLAAEAATVSQAAADRALAAAVNADADASVAVNAANWAAQDAATSEAYADVTMAWAEHMPGTIPPNILAVMGISGDHWSARWWANRAAQLVAEGGLPPGGVAGQVLKKTGPNPEDVTWGTDLQAVGGPGSVAWADISSKPTTVAGFAISDAYTISQVDQRLSQKAALAHTHPASDISGSGAFGRTFLTTASRAEAAALLETFGAAKSGLVPGSPGSSDRFLRADGAWAIPAGGGGGGGGSSDWADITGKPTTIAGYGITDAYTKAQVDTYLNQKANLVHTHTASDISNASAAGRSMLTAADAAAQTALLNAFTTSAKGLVPASGGGTVNYLRADGTWAPASGSGLVTVAHDTSLTGNGTSGSPLGINRSITDGWYVGFTAFNQLEVRVDDLEDAVALVQNPLQYLGAIAFDAPTPTTPAAGVTGFYIFNSEGIRPARPTEDPPGGQMVHIGDWLAYSHVQSKWLFLNYSARTVLAENVAIAAIAAIPAASNVQEALEATNARIPSPLPVGLPSGGAAGEVLKKGSGADYDVYWGLDQTGGGGGGTDLPPGGSSGQVLKKLSGADNDIGWRDDTTGLVEVASGTSLTGLGTAALPLDVDFAVLDNRYYLETEGLALEGQVDTLEQAISALQGPLQYKGALSYSDPTPTPPPSGQYWVYIFKDNGTRGPNAGEDPSTAYQVSAGDWLAYSHPKAKWQYLAYHATTVIARDVPIDPINGLAAANVQVALEEIYDATFLPYDLAGGTTGQVLRKNSNADFDFEWGTGGTSVPGGGTTGQVLTKLSATPGDADWRDNLVAVTTDLTLTGDGTGGSPLGVDVAYLGNYVYSQAEGDALDTRVSDLETAVAVLENPLQYLGAIGYDAQTPTTPAAGVTGFYIFNTEGIRPARPSEDPPGGQYVHIGDWLAYSHTQQKWVYLNYSARSVLATGVGMDPPITELNNAATVQASFVELVQWLEAIPMLPPGGSPGQVLKKLNSSDYAMHWADDELGGLGNGDVTGPNGATTGRIAMFADGSGKVIADSGFSTSNFAEAVHTHVIGDVQNLQAALDQKQNIGLYPTVKNPVTSRDLVASDRAALVVSGVSAATTLNIPANNDTDFPVGTRIDIITWANPTTITIVNDGAGQSLASVGGARTITVYGAATLTKVAPSSWHISGALE